MATAKDVYDREYKKANYDNILVRVKKGKKEEYQQVADDFGFGQAEMFRLAIEEFIANHTGEVMIPAQMAARSADKLSAEQKRLLAEFSKLPADAQKSLMKFLKTINGTSKTSGECKSNTTRT